MKAKPGAILKIPLPSGRWCYGRLYKDSTVGVYFTSVILNLQSVTSVKPNLIAGVFTRDFKSGKWVICDHLPFETDEAAWPPPTFSRDIISSKLRIYFKGEFHSATEAEVEGLHKDLMYKPEQLAEEIDKLWTKT